MVKPVTNLIHLSLPQGSPAKSPQKRSTVACSFYGKQKPHYLTPLERKLVKELKGVSAAPALPPPPPPKKQTAKKSKPSAGTKQRKKGTASAQAVKSAMKSCMAPPKRISLKNLSRRFETHCIYRSHTLDIVFLFLTMSIIICF